MVLLVLATSRSRFVIFELHHLLAYVCFINFLLSMLLSKISNSVFVNPGIYSCAVDALLEISTHLFLPFVSNLCIRNEFTDLLFNVCSHYQKRGQLYSDYYFLFIRKVGVLI